MEKECERIGKGRSRGKKIEDGIGAVKDRRVRAEERAKVIWRKNVGGQERGDAVILRVSELPTLKNCTRLRTVWIDRIGRMWEDRKDVKE